MGRAACMRTGLAAITSDSNGREHAVTNKHGQNHGIVEFCVSRWWCSASGCGSGTLVVPSNADAVHKISCREGVHNLVSCTSHITSAAAAVVLHHGRLVGSSSLFRREAAEIDALDRDAVRVVSVTRIACKGFRL